MDNTYITITASFLTALAVLAAILIFVLWRNTEKSRKKLAQKYFEMGKQAERQERQNFLNDLHKLRERQQRRREDLFK